MIEKIFCPNCPPTFHRTRPEIRTGQTMNLIETNYSGCGVDIYFCEKCQKSYQVSYKVDQITEVE